MSASVEELFRKFITKLQPLSNEHYLAESHKESVERCLSVKFNCYNFFETGSFGNGTGVRHFSDTDYFAVIPSDKLSSNSSISLRSMKEALQLTFPRTKDIVVRSPVVRIPFGNYVSERLEVTPSIFRGLVTTPLGSKGVYKIPDYGSSWLNSSPQAHIAYVNHHNKRLEGKLKPLIQLIKAWKFYNQIPITSFYLELFVTKYSESETTIVYNIDVKNVLVELYKKKLRDLQDPMLISGNVSSCKSTTKKDYSISRLELDYNTVKDITDMSDANQIAEKWNYVFNGKFPLI